MICIDYMMIWLWLYDDWVIWLLYDWIICIDYWLFFPNVVMFWREFSTCSEHTNIELDGYTALTFHLGSKWVPFPDLDFWNLVHKWVRCSDVPVLEWCPFAQNTEILQQPIEIHQNNIVSHKQHITTDENIFIRSDRQTPKTRRLFNNQSRYTRKTESHLTEHHYGMA